MKQAAGSSPSRDRRSNTLPSGRASTAPQVMTASHQKLAKVTSAAGAVQRARELIKARSKRFDIFSENVSAVFGDPAWDMLLDLFIAHADRKIVSVSDLCLVGRASQTTCIRYISELVAAGVIIKTPDKTDSRRILVTLSKQARQSMEEILA